MVSARTFIVSLAAVTCAFAQSEQRLASNSFTPSPTPKPDASAAIKLTPEQRGDVYMARKMFREAIDSYRDGPQNSAVTWNKIGIAYHQLGDFGAARRNYEKAIKVDKKYADAVNNLGTVYYAEKRYKNAISRYRHALDLKPDTASFWSNLGTAYYSRGKFPQMTAAYEKALSIDPDVFEHRGVVGTELQDRSVTDRARYHYEMARMYAKSGKNELALQYLRKSLEEGLKDKVKMTSVPEFAGLRETPEFQELMTLEPRVL
ncbi:MAG TPA: tetratricopeptide repeat protein [Bryobacteraceae bacterium]|nr:tetratricopeptide repeat protein [Bryobacteraceae bacterium]